MNSSKGCFRKKIFKSFAPLYSQSRVSRHMNKNQVANPFINKCDICSFIVLVSMCFNSAGQLYRHSKQLGKNERM